MTNPVGKNLKNKNKKNRLLSDFVFDRKTRREFFVLFITQAIMKLCLITTNVKHKPSFMHISDYKRTGKKQASFEQNLKQVIFDSDSTCTDIIETITDNFFIYSEKPVYRQLKKGRPLADSKRDATEEKKRQQNLGNDMEIDEPSLLEPDVGSEVKQVPNDTSYSMEVEEQNPTQIENVPNEVATFIIRSDSNLDEVLYGKCAFFGVDEKGERATLKKGMIAKLKNSIQYFKNGPANVQSTITRFSRKLHSKFLPLYKTLKKQYQQLPPHEIEMYEAQAREKYGNDYEVGNGSKLFYRVVKPEMNIDPHEEFEKLSLSERKALEDQTQSLIQKRKEEMKRYRQLKPPLKAPNVKASTLYEESQDYKEDAEYKSLPKNHPLVKKYKLLARQTNYQIKKDYRDLCRRVGRIFDPRWEKDICRYELQQQQANAPSITGKKRKKQSTTKRKAKKRKLTRKRKPLGKARIRAKSQSKKNRRQLNKRKKKNQAPVISESDLEMEMSVEVE